MAWRWIVLFAINHYPVDNMHCKPPYSTPLPPEENSLIVNKQPFRFFNHLSDWIIYVNFQVSLFFNVTFLNREKSIFIWKPSNPFSWSS